MSNQVQNFDPVTTLVLDRTTGVYRDPRPVPSVPTAYPAPKTASEMPTILIATTLIGGFVFAPIPMFLTVSVLGINSIMKRRARYTPSNVVVSPKVPGANNYYKETTEETHITHITKKTVEYGTR